MDDIPKKPSNPNVKIQDKIIRHYYAKKIIKEKYLYLALCSDEDRQRIEGNIEMDIRNFERMSYILETLGLDNFNAYFENKYNDFLTQLAKQIEYAMENETLEDEEKEAECYQQWLCDFSNQLPSPILKDYVNHIFAL